MPPPTHPVLKPALRRAWRDPATLQLGVGGDRAVILAGMGSDDARLLDLLDGTRAVPDVLAHAGVDADRGGELLALLQAADVLDEPARPPDDARLMPDLLALSLLHRGDGAATRVLERRAERSVVVHGAGRVGAAVAGLLVAAGVGRVDVVDRGPVRPADLSPAGLRRAQPGTRAAAVVEGMPRRRGRAGMRARAPSRPHDLAIVTPVGSVAAPETFVALRTQSHLLAVVRQNVATIGPLVVPGRTPCLRCVELARGDRDPGWPAVAAQLVGTSAGVEACDIVLATLAASLTAMQALTYLDAATTPATAGGVLEFALRTGRLRRRSVPAHPACGCSAGSAPDTMEP